MQISIVVPCYNEEEALPYFFQAAVPVMNGMEQKYHVSFEMIFVDDGSRDQTLKVMKDLKEKDQRIRYISFSRNFGKEAAMYAGMEKSNGDLVSIMDADLQDDIEAMDAFIEKYHAGNDIVYGVRSSRKKDSFFKRSTALAYYRFLQKMGVDIIYNHADYRLMSRRALEALADFKEVNLFLRGIVPLIGFQTAVVEYERSSRFAGESKYPLKKMLSFAIDGITSFSIKPIRMITALGFLIFAFSLIMLIYSIVIKITGHADSGWASLICSIWMIGGIQLLSLGIIGEYIGKIYNETKARPRYIIEEFINRVE